MVNPDSLALLSAILGIDFQNESFLQVAKKLADSGMMTFRLNLEDVTICMAFNDEACRALNNAVTGYLNARQS